MVALKVLLKVVQMAMMKVCMMADLLAGPLAAEKDDLMVAM